MAQWPARTWTIGELVTGGMFNSLRDALNELHSQVRPNGGIWTDVPFAAANFYQQSGLWTVAAGNIIINRYTQIGKLVIWTLHVNGSTITGTPSWLYLMPPVPAMAAPAYAAKPSVALNGATSINGAYLYKEATSPYGLLTPGPGTPTWLAGTFSLAFTWLFEAVTI